MAWLVLKKLLVLCVVTVASVHGSTVLTSDKTGNMNLTAAAAVNVHSPSLSLDGFLKVGATVSVINVANTAQLVAAWQSLQGQPLSLPVTIQLAAGTYNLTSSAGYVVLGPQPFGRQITIQGNTQDASQVVFVGGGLVFEGVDGVLIQYVTFTCVDTALFSLSSALIVSDSAVTATNIVIEAICSSANIWVGQAYVPTGRASQSSFSLSNSQLNGDSTAVHGVGLLCADSSSCSLSSVTISYLAYGLRVSSASAYVTNCGFAASYGIWAEQRASVVAASVSVTCVVSGTTQNCQGFSASYLSQIFINGVLTVPSMVYLFVASYGGGVFDNTGQYSPSFSGPFTLYSINRGFSLNGYSNICSGSNC